MLVNFESLSLTIMLITSIPDKNVDPRPYDFCGNFYFPNQGVDGLILLDDFALRIHVSDNAPLIN